MHLDRGAEARRPEDLARTRVERAEAPAVVAHERDVPRRGQHTREEARALLIGQTSSSVSTS